MLEEVFQFFNWNKPCVVNRSVILLKQAIMTWNRFYDIALIRVTYLISILLVMCPLDLAVTRYNGARICFKIGIAQ